MPRSQAQTQVILSSTFLMFKRLLLILLLLAFAFSSADADRFYARTCLTGGTAGCLDDLDITAAGAPNTSNLANGDAAIVVVGDISYTYQFHSAATDTEASPHFIRPDDYSTAGVWYLVSTNVTQLPEISDPDTWTMSGIGMYGGTWIANADGTGNLPAAAPGMYFTVKARGAVTPTLEPNGSEEIFLNGTSCTAGVNIAGSGTAGDEAVCQYSASGDWDCDAVGFSCGS